MKISVTQLKADVFGFYIADVSGSIRLFSDVMKRLGIKLDGDEMYEEFREFMKRVLVELLIRQRLKIGCGIWIDEDDFTASLFYNLKECSRNQIECFTTKL